MRKKILFVTLFLLAAVLLSGCTGATAWPGLSANGEVAYLANTNVVYAVNAKTGAKLWNFSGEGGGFLNMNPSMFVTTPVITPDGLLVVLDSGNKHVMYGVDPNDVSDETPNVEWRFDQAKGHWIASPLIVKNRMFAPNSDGNVYVLDLDDGQSEKDAIKVIRLSASSGQTDRLWAQPLTDGTRIFVTSLDHRIFAISLETYEVLWEKQLDAAIPGAPALGADGMLYVGSLAKKLERIDPATGKNESVLGQEIKDWVWGTPIAEGDNLYFGDVSGNFYSYNVITGKLNWDLKLDGAITASPLIFRDQILVATESGVIYAVTADGNTEIWHQPAEEKSKAYTTPVQAGDYVLVAYLESDYYLVALDQDGDVKWTFTGK